MPQKIDNQRINEYFETVIKNEIEKQMLPIKEEMAELILRQGNMKINLEQLNQNNNNLRTDLDEIINIQEDFGILEERVEALETLNKNKYTNYKETITKIEARLDNIKTLISNNFMDIKTLKEKVEEEIEEIKQKIEGIESDSEETDKYIRDVQSNLTSYFITKIEKVQKELSELRKLTTITNPNVPINTDSAFLKNLRQDIDSINNTLKEINTSLVRYQPTK